MTASQARSSGAIGSERTRRPQRSFLGMKGWKGRPASSASGAKDQVYATQHLQTKMLSSPGWFPCRNDISCKLPQVMPLKGNTSSICLGVYILTERFSRSVLDGVGDSCMGEGLFRSHRLWPGQGMCVKGTCFTLFARNELEGCSDTVQRVPFGEFMG